MRSTTFPLAAALGVAALGLLAWPAARAGAPEAAVECRWADRPPVLDGRVSPDEWRGAAVIPFGRPWETDPARRTPATATRARLLWDREYLYFAAEMDDEDLLAPVTEHDGRLWDGDVFELFFKPAEDAPGYYEFQVNPAGARLDMFMPRRGGNGYERYRADGEFVFETKVRLSGSLNRPGDRDRSWSVEGRLRWADLLRTGGRPAPGEQWRFALCRYDYTTGRRPETSTSAPLTQPSIHRYEDYAGLNFVGPAAPAQLGWQPLTTSRVVGSPDPPAPYRLRRRYPALRLDYPVTAVREPGAERLLAILQDVPGGASRLVRFRDSETATDVETLLTWDRRAYDLVFHPQFERNGYLYLSSCGPLAAPTEDKRMQVTRYTLGGPNRQPDPAAATVILEWWSDGHDGGAMAFGQDGKFYLTTGDGTTDSDTRVVGQDLSTLLAKVLRLDLERPDAGRHYSVPPDNPFVGRAGARPETWAYGLRNPWRITADRETGHVWVGNNGQDLWESAYLVTKGANYGWSVYEGSHPFYPTRRPGPDPIAKPTLEHPHSEARSLTGGIVYYGRRHPELRGAYVYGDYSTGKIWAAKHDGTRLLWHRELVDTPLQITGFCEDSRGELLVCDMRGGGEGAFYELEPAPPSRPAAPFPRRLSESGLFREVRGHRPQPGLIPYEVNAPLWSDGAHKERFIGLPGADARIDFAAARGWNFPDGTVLVKSFALETEEGNPRSRRWVETRFLTRQQGEWVGYSYEWNDEQTDALLVEREGKDREFGIRVRRSREAPDGIRKQVWRYPSRAECMVCHTRAANFVLGLTLHQMNRLRDYGGGYRANQIEVLERLGVLRTDWSGEARGLLRGDAKRSGKSDGEADAAVAALGPQPGQRGAAQSGMLALPPDRYDRLTDPYDRRADLNLRARSYLHANCAPCHVEAGGGNAQMELELTTPAERMRLLGVRPVHHTYNLPDARLVAPGRPGSSVLLHRIRHRGEGRMPPLATSVVDSAAVRLLEDWIRSLPAE
jgi:glucose/arabinose dehydrogenase